MRIRIDVPVCDRTRIRTPACGTFTPTFGCSAFQYSRRVVEQRHGVLAADVARPARSMCSVNESAFSSENGAS